MKGQGEEKSETEKYIFSFAPKVSSGLDHFACVGYHKNKPTVFCWGGNTSNQLGVGINTRECKVPTPVPFFEDLFISSVCCTYYCTFVLAKRNALDVGCSVYSFGKGNNGLLGFRKKRIAFSKRVDAHAEGKEKLLRKRNSKVDQRLLDAFGVGKGGEPSPSLKHGNDDNSSSDRGDHGNRSDRSDRSDDGLLHFDVDKISSEEGSSEDALPVNDYAEEKADWFTPVPMKVKFPERTKIMFISCGDMHTLVICTRGFLYGWGGNTFGCVGNGTNRNVYEPTPIFVGGRKGVDPGDKFGGVQGGRQAFGNENNRDVIIHCSAGGKHSLACTLSGDMYSWGYGANGRLGLESIQSYNRPQLVKALQKKNRIIYVCSGESHSGCIDADNNVYTWGNGKYYKLGHGDDNDVWSPKRLEYLCRSRKIFMLSFGTFNSVALSAKGDIFLWGVFTNIKRGFSSYTCKIPKKVNTNYKCLSVHASVYMSLGVTVVGDLIVLGDCSRVIAPGGSGSSSNVISKGNYGGESDSGDSNVDVLDHLIGSEANCIHHLNRNNEFPIRYVKELRGKVHVKDIISTFYMLDKETFPSRWGEQSRLNNGSELYGDDVADGTFSKKGLIIRSKIKMIDGSEYFTMFLLQSGKLYTCGVNKNGELANGQYTIGKKFSVPIPVEVCVNKIVKIACGYNYTLALNERGLLYGWGANDKSQLGVGVNKDFYEPVLIKSLNKVIDVYAGHDHSACIVNNSFDENDLKENSNHLHIDKENILQEGDLYTWGSAESGKVGLGVDYTQGVILLPRRINLKSKIQKCSLGYNHTLILTDSGDLYACGSSSSGKLGVRDDNISYMVSTPKKVHIDPRIYIKEMVAGATYSMILSMDGFIYIWGEFIKNELSSEVPMLYPQISKVKHIIGGKDKHVLLHTYDNKLFGIGDNAHMQILHDEKETCIRGRPKLIPYFMRDRNIESAYSFKNASFVQLEGSYDVFAWGYTSNCHLGIGVTNATHLKQPKKVIKVWVTYEEADAGGDNDSDIGREDGLLGGPINPLYNDEIADEVDLVRRRVLKRTTFEDDLICGSPYQEEEVENIIKRIQMMPHLLNWDSIQLLLKKERYTNSIQYVRSFERDLIDIYTKHMEFLLNLHSMESKYNELLLTYQHYILSNVVYLGEEKPSIMFSENTHIFDSNREKLQRFVYIIQHQPMYLVILCQIHNCKNLKYGGGCYQYYAYEYGGGGNQKDKPFGKTPYQLQMETNNMDERNDRCDHRSSQEKRTFYRNSTRILCSFIFDLYHDLRDERVRNIFTIFLIKLGVEEINNCLHLEALFREDTSIFFILIRMLFLKNDVLVTFARCLADMGNANSFVRLVDSLSRCVPEGEGAQTAEGSPLVLDSFHVQPTRPDAIMHDSLSPSSINHDALARASVGVVPPKRTPPSAPTCNRFIDEANDPLDKEFAAFMKGQVPENNDPLNLPINMYSGLTPIPHGHLEGKLLDHLQGVVPTTGQRYDQNPNEPMPASQRNVLIEIDMVHVFRELCRLFEKMSFPEIFQIVVKNLFKHLSLCEMNRYSENDSENRIFYFSGEHFVYVPFFHLFIMAILNPMLRDVDKMAERFYLPVIPPHVSNLCKRISTLLEVFCVNKYECLSRYNLKESFVSVKFILQRTFSSMVTVTNMLCKNKENVYLNAYINMFSYHLSMKPCYVYLKVFQLCHLFNLFFRFQNYLCLSFDDPAMGIVNEFFACQGGGNGKDQMRDNGKDQMRDNGKRDPPSDVTRKVPVNDAMGRASNAKQNKNFLLRLMTKGKKAGGQSKGSKMRGQPEQHEQIKQHEQPAQHVQTKTRHERRLIFTEAQIDLFAQCKLVYNIQLDIRFLLEEKNMSICEFTKIPMPQSMCYRKKTRIRNKEYLFSIIQEYKQATDEIYIVSECLRACPLLEPCTETSTLLIKLKALRANFLSLAQHKEANLVGLIDKAVDIFLSNEMVYVNHEENIPPNLYTHKFKQNYTQQTKQPFERFLISQNGDNSNSFFFLKWRNIALQICLEILKKKKQLNFLKKLHERQGKIDELIFRHQNEVKENMKIMKRGLILISKLLIEKPILIHSSLFGKNLFFVKMKIDKDIRRREKNNFSSFYNTSTVHVYSVKRLHEDGVLDSLNEMLLPVVDLLSLEIFFDIDNALKLSLVLRGGAERKVLHVQTFRGRDIQRMYTRSPFISYSLFAYNRESLCSIRAFSFVHLLHDLVVDLY
ncbi:guanidine nucleotide exchange factor, putative [Plasmodium knowlesi strain H]|uniref:Guanidine nucleotide exchange factor, putative n=3 Tax=Plasmodium knowlesi TaxID=5850 RepID=A0A5K1V1P2_PLAKH|nr:guanidine nucleotide exchange factor, putative [Plasmodium knowlesi strain H]OTN67118.1 putative Guanidine nucleotide exchange factor [Plasmodium knowlesi]CAA9988755.1 guanidine nucleotide exchange factor, putative [Plasmodium knowlesi strain H]SBO21704.1 guanidine nucleotide exchange factor, putative [Plasmodium knowlesi strain H]SBO22085.1 guanidine nucleotide exchange factor, putative [Plasmodium knowlesi strain H]VVS78229.1 guanidine nucleotide exchange factor, putative [Plasmodium know|eukprot:XP_002259731.1 guanidine nucleotide exchange factor, putative [Plasmodium knowlesi strain H]